MRSLLLSLLCLAPAGAAYAQSGGQPEAPAAAMMAPVPTTRVLAIGLVDRGPDPAAMRTVMPSEVSDTVKLYLAGKIDQWYVRQDGKGVVFLLNASSVEEASAIVSKLPLVVGGRMHFDFMALGPLSPLRFLLGPASAPKP